MSVWLLNFNTSATPALLLTIVRMRSCLDSSSNPTLCVRIPFQRSEPRTPHHL
ncbi:cation transporter [Moniliophthora roreri]|nr:cation transporter [Moniliophthora roreri]